MENLTERVRRQFSGRARQTIGRIVLWAAVGLVVVRGVGSILADHPTRPAHDTATATRSDSAFPMREASAFAVRFARTYLEVTPKQPQRHQQQVAGFLAEGLGDQAAAVLPSHGSGMRVALATVAREAPLSSSRAQITVATTSTTDTTRYLSVPVAVDRHGGLSVAGLPALVAPPARGTTTVSDPDEMSGPQAGPIRDLVSRFLTTYLAGRGGSALSYYLAPNAHVVQMPRGLTVVSVGRLAHDPHPVNRAAGTAVLVPVRVRDTVTRAVYPLAYHLRVVHRDRWYVAEVAGGVGA